MTDFRILYTHFLHMPTFKENGNEFYRDSAGRLYCLMNDSRYHMINKELYERTGEIKKVIVNGKD